MNEHDNFTRNCSCTVACDETDFTAIATASTWPSNEYWVNAFEYLDLAATYCG